MDRGAWRAIVRGVAKSWAWLSDFHFHFFQDSNLEENCLLSLWSHLTVTMAGRSPTQRRWALQLHWSSGAWKTKPDSGCTAPGKLLGGDGSPVSGAAAVADTRATLRPLSRWQRPPAASQRTLGASLPILRIGPQDALGPPMRWYQRLQLSVASQLSLTRHKELLRGLTEVPTVIGRGPRLPQGPWIMRRQQGGAREGSRPWGRPDGSSSLHA